MKYTPIELILNIIPDNLIILNENEKNEKCNYKEEKKKKSRQKKDLFTKPYFTVFFFFVFLVRYCIQISKPKHLGHGYQKFSFRLNNDKLIMVNAIRLKFRVWENVYVPNLYTIKITMI